MILIFLYVCEFSTAVNKKTDLHQSFVFILLYVLLYYFFGSIIYLQKMRSVSVLPFKITLKLKEKGRIFPDVIKAHIALKPCDGYETVVMSQ